jgi:protein phosphatase
MESDSTIRRLDLLSISPFNVAGDSHPGLVREQNEDSFGYYVGEGLRRTLLAVADGIGGHECGDIASNLCMKMLVSSWRGLRNKGSIDETACAEFLDEKLRRANEIIYNINETYSIQMGTTVVAAILLPKSIVVAHAGDSRLYRLRDGRLERLTNDHSFVAELVRKKVISEVEALTHPFAHIISRSIGPAPDLNLEINTFERRIADKYLLCTDGLTQHVADYEIQRVLYDAFDPQQAVKRLLNMAIRGGGEDNITIVSVFA